MSYNFKFGGTWLSGLYAVTTERPPIEIAQYDFTLLDIPGRNGDEFIDNKRYKNVVMNRPIGFMKRASSVINFEEQLISWLAYNQGYREFEDTDHPGLVTYAVLTNFAEVQIILRRIKKATLRFSRKPCWYNKQSLSPIIFGNEAAALEGTTLNNPYPLDAESLVEVVVDGSLSSTSYFRIKIGSYENIDAISRYQITPTRNHIIFDVENQEIRTQAADGTNVKYINNLIPPALPPGASVVKILEATSGLVQSMNVTPKWRRL